MRIWLYETKSQNTSFRIVFVCYLTFYFFITVTKVHIRRKVTSDTTQWNQIYIFHIFCLEHQVFWCGECAKYPAALDQKVNPHASVHGLILSFHCFPSSYHCFDSSPSVCFTCSLTRPRYPILCRVLLVAF